MSHDITTIDDSSDEGDDEGSDEDTQLEERVAEWLHNAPDYHVHVPSGIQKGINKLAMRAVQARAASRPARDEKAFRTRLMNELVWGTARQQLPGVAKPLWLLPCASAPRAPAHDHERIGYATWCQSLPKGGEVKYGKHLHRR
jgi:hypothetical protein